eukprot:CAMPEP_0117456066 /NCGR_PEP_ID=MMETSP0759-20121206/11685_1 /TAXON_ID=63605 /ORGANISM="Percolomonas cosmopolitus, Strain WS" /LENGTH=1125 /DNA_ID=CAMNT_0005249393 /DNA_START=270 /DNA_END=3648 /DNA_ORIENTATION=+
MNNPLGDIHDSLSGHNRGHQLQYIAPVQSVSPTNFQQQSHKNSYSHSQQSSSPHKRVHQLKNTGLRKSGGENRSHTQNDDDDAPNLPLRSQQYQPLRSEADFRAINSTVLYQDDQADIYHYTVDFQADALNPQHQMENTQKSSTTTLTGNKTSQDKTPLDGNSGATKKLQKRVMKIHEKTATSKLGHNSHGHTRPSSADSVERLLKPGRKNISLPQDEHQNLLSASVNLKKRTPKYYRDLLAADRSTDVSYLLDAELKTLTVNQIMNQRKQGKKLPPLHNGSHDLSAANPLQERIKFPSVLGQVLRMIGKPTELNLPPTKIPEEFHVNENSPIVTDQKKESTFDPETGIWNTHTFPSKIPTSRVEVVHLSKAFEQMIHAVKETTKMNSIEELTALMDVLDAVGTEVVRQVHVHCAERGVLLKVLLEVFQNTNKQALYFYQKARQMVYHKHNEMKSNNLVAQKNNEVNLFRNEVHELKLKLREQREQIKKLMKDREMQAAELQKVQEEQFRRLRAHAPKQIAMQTTMTMQRIDLLEAKAMEALNEEHRRIEEQKRQEEEERAAAQALKDAQEELRRAEEERLLLEEMRRKEEEEKSDDEFLDVDKDNDKRVQTDYESTVSVNVQTDAVKFKNKRNKKEKRKLKYRNSPTRPKTPPRVSQPIMQPVVQPVSVGGDEFEVRQNTLESRGNGSSDDDEDEVDRVEGDTKKSNTRHQTLVVPKKSMRQKSPRTRGLRKPKPVVPLNQKSPKSRSDKPRTRADKTSEVKLRTLSQDDLFELFHDLVVNNHGSRKYSLRWVNKNVLDLLSELTDSDFLASTTDMRNIRRFVYDYHLVKFGLATIAVQHLAEFLHNVKQYYRESSRVRTFIQFCVLAQWYGKEQQDIYTLSTLSLYLRALNFTKSILNKKALKELEEGTLYVSETFVFNLLDRLKLPLSEDEHQQFFNTVSQQSEEGYIYFDDLSILLIATYHKHEEGQTIVGDVSDVLNVPQGEENDPVSAKNSARSSGKTSSVSVAAFKRVVRNFFGKIYVVGTDVNDPTFVRRNENITKRDLVQVYTQCQRLVVEIINSLEQPDVRGKFLEVHSNLYRIVNEVALEEALTHYKNYMCVLLHERQDENSQVFSRMISNLMH